uniref:Uncharacterized protein n=1 Tax=Chromera velia CCMP2878 TaxID=1169474 RepID=A0A0G4HMK9_9ALVE|eukprot:Cvel_7568.t1-p1 / transcript=Cvel_7568.t1 / gene=Cvel_7568 / organism=Chromera_velia_CCMP2878 / gene_product=hypothetical protein / transcript_product=hypothetical protein / location=Cvel_scaffold398:60295-60924(-) / protein_length=210 / sequence_SO=supercontig / SO=protein_coding / is_pseudo=false
MMIGRTEAAGKGKAKRRREKQQRKRERQKEVKHRAEINTIRQARGDSHQTNLGASLQGVSVEVQVERRDRVAVQEDRKRRKEERKEWKRQEIQRAEINALRQRQSSLLENQVSLRATGEKEQWGRFSSNSVPQLRDPREIREQQYRITSVHLRSSMETGHTQGKRGFGSSAAPPLRKNVQTYQLASICYCDRVETPSMKGDAGGAQSGET